MQQICVRLSEGDRELLDLVCSARGEPLAAFIRRAVRKELATLEYYNDDIRKALGLHEKEDHKN